MKTYTFATNIILLLVVGITASCQTLGRPKMKIKVDQDSQATKLDNQSFNVRKGESIESESEPLLIESPGHISTLIVPLTGGSIDLNVRLRAVEAWGGELYEQRSNSQMSELMSRVIEIQHLLMERKSQEALAEYMLLEARFPRVSYLKFLKTSCLMINNRFEDAKRSLEEALVIFPSDKVGLDLKKSLDRLVSSQGGQ